MNAKVIFKKALVLFAIVFFMHMQFRALLMAYFSLKVMEANEVINGGMPLRALFVFCVLCSFIASAFISKQLLNFIFQKERPYLLYRVLTLSFIAATLFLLTANIIFPFLTGFRFEMMYRDDLSLIRFIREFAIAFQYMALLSFVIFSFMDINIKLGQTVLLNFFMGTYKKPVEEVRTLFFIDLKDSTKHAEALGHCRYTEFLQYLFYQVGKVISKHKGQIYQYVGDEIIFSWKDTQAFTQNDCLQCYFSITQFINDIKDTFLKRYGFCPQFRVGIHHGKLMISEIGFNKIDVAFVGDTINTTARIMSLADDYNCNLLISSCVKEHLTPCPEYTFINKGETAPKGKSNPVTLYTVEPSYDGH